MTQITLSRPTLFIEFFVREVSFQGKGNQRTMLPSDAFFYTGPSKAISWTFWQQNSIRAQKMGVERWQKKRQTTPPPPLMAFIEQRPAISASAIDQGMDKIWFTTDLAAVVCIGEEFLQQNEWLRLPDRVLTHRYGGEHDCFRHLHMHKQFPHDRFCHVTDVDTQGVMWSIGSTPAPIKVLSPGETCCYLWRRVETSHRHPNLNMVMFVKSYGLHEQVSIVTPEEILRNDSSRLCEEIFTLRDFRQHQRV